VPAALGFVNEVPRAPLKAASLSHDPDCAPEQQRERWRAPRVS